MKKLFSVLAVLFVLGTTSAFARTGIGLQGSLSAGGSTAKGAGVTFKLSNVPCVFAVAAPNFVDPLIVGVSADWWIANPVIEQTWHYYYGVGLAGAVTLVENGSSISIGGRALVGTNVFLVNNFLEFYLQGAWQPMFTISNGAQPNIVNFPFDLGFRFWF